MLRGTQCLTFLLCCTILLIYCLSPVCTSAEFLLCLHVCVCVRLWKQLWIAEYRASFSHIKLPHRVQKSMSFIRTSEQPENGPALTLLPIRHNVWIPRCSLTPVLLLAWAPVCFYFFLADFSSYFQASHWTAVAAECWNVWETRLVSLNALMQHCWSLRAC